jgi:hypothetical protein
MVIHASGAPGTSRGGEARDRATGNAIYVDMHVLCQAEKAPCDRLVEEFKQLNDGMRRDMQRKATQNKGI